MVADAGRDPEHASRDEILCLPDGRVGFKVVDPATGKRHAASGFDELREAERAADEAETRRLYYVAMTRAIDRLIVSGAVDPTSTRDAKAPIRWILDRLEADLESGQPVELEREGARVLLRVDRRDDGTAEPDESTAAQLELFAAVEGAATRAAPELPPLGSIPEPPAFRIRSLSYSSLALYGRCSYRFYAERIAGLRMAQPSAAVAGAEGLAATEIGDAVHVALEHGVPGAETGELVRSRYPAATPEDLERVSSLVDAWHSSALAGELRSGPEPKPELAFAFEHDGVLLHGRFDLFRLADGRVLVVDYKTNRLEDLTPEEALEDDYSLQRLVYALASFRAGAEEVEVAYVFLERPEDVVRRTFVRDEVPGSKQNCPRRSRRSTTATFVPLRVSSHAPAARPSMWSAPARGCYRLPPPSAPTLRPRGEEEGRAEAGAHQARDRAARGGSPGRRHRASLPQRCRAPHLGASLGTDDGRDRKSRH